MKYCYHIWVIQSSPFSLERRQKHSRRHVDDELISTIQPLCHKRNVASLSHLFHYYYNRCPDVFYSLVSPVVRFIARTRYAMFTVANLRHSRRALSLRSKNHINSFFPRSVVWRTDYRENISLNAIILVSMSRVNIYVLHDL